MPPFGHFSLIRFGKIAEGSATAQSNMQSSPRRAG